MSSDDNTQCLTGLPYPVYCKNIQARAVFRSYTPQHIHVRVRACVSQAGVTHNFYQFFKVVFLANAQMIICMIEIIDQLSY